MLNNQLVAIYMVKETVAVRLIFRVSFGGISLSWQVNYIHPKQKKKGD
jgi:hypothetical protein